MTERFDQSRPGARCREPTSRGPGSTPGLIRGARCRARGRETGRSSRTVLEHGDPTIPADPPTVSRPEGPLGDSSLAKGLGASPGGDAVHEGRGLSLSKGHPLACRSSTVAGNTQTRVGMSSSESWLPFRLHGCAHGVARTSRSSLDLGRVPWGAQRGSFSLS